MKKETHMKGICPYCEKERELTIVRTVQGIKVQREEIPVDVEYFQCKICKQDFDDPKSEQDPLETAYREYRTRHDKKGYKKNSTNFCFFKPK